MQNLETRNLASGSSVLGTVGKYGGLVLGVLGGLEVAAGAETILGKVISVLGGLFVGGYVGKKAAQSLA